MLGPQPNAQLVQFGVFQADLRAGELWKQGRKLKLQMQPFQALTALLEKPGELVTREELRARLWPADAFVDFDQALNKSMNAIRETLGDTARTPRFVETLPKRGYRFIAPVTYGAANVDTQPVPANVAQVTVENRAKPDIQPVSSLPGQTRRKLRLAAGVIGIALFILILSVAVLRAFRPVFAPPNHSAIRSIAVLPLRNQSADPESDYFADGMTDELITILAGIRDLRVISHTSAARYKDSTEPISELLRKLNVDAVMQGSVLRSSDRVRINLQLMEARPEGHVWTASYERSLGDVLRVQADVARSVSQELRLKFTPSAAARLSRTGPVQPQAYEAYLKGRYFWNKRSEAALNKAVEYFRTAIRIDPEYAPPYAGLADSYLTLNAGVIPAENVVKAKVAAARAIQLDDTHAEAHTSLARAEMADWNLEGAETEFQRALELDPNYVTAHQWYGLYLAITGRRQPASAELQRSLDLDPVSLTSNWHLGLGWYFFGDYDQAIEQFRRTLDLDPGFLPARRWLGLAYALKGNFPAAIQECEASRQRGDNWMSLWALTYTQAAAGERAKALKGLEELMVYSRQTYISPYLIAAVHSALGETDVTFEWLDRAYREKTSSLPLIEVHGWFGRVRADSRFSDLVRRIGIPIQSAVGLGRVANGKR